MKGNIVLDTKETIWYRQYFFLEEEMTPEEFLEAVEQGELESQTGEYIYEAAERMEPEDNSGNPTIEIFESLDNPPIYTNA